VGLKKGGSIGATVCRLLGGERGGKRLLLGKKLQSSDKVLTWKRSMFPKKNRRNLQKNGDPKRGKGKLVQQGENKYQKVARNLSGSQSLKRKKENYWA